MTEQNRELTTEEGKKVFKYFISTGSSKEEQAKLSAVKDILSIDNDEVIFKNENKKLALTFAIPLDILSSEAAKDILNGCSGDKYSNFMKQSKGWVNYKDFISYLFNCEIRTSEKSHTSDNMVRDIDNSRKLGKLVGLVKEIINLFINDYNAYFYEFLDYKIFRGSLMYELTFPADNKSNFNLIYSKLLWYKLTGFYFNYYDDKLLVNVSYEVDGNENIQHMVAFKLRKDEKFLESINNADCLDTTELDLVISIIENYINATMLDIFSTAAK